MNTMARCYEDFAVGEVVEAGPVVVTADAIKAFAAQFDPQPSYPNDTSPDAAVADQVASGLHITCLNMRLLVDAFLCDTKAMGSPGVEEICYFTPVRAGDSLTMRLEVVGLRRSPGPHPQGRKTGRPAGGTANKVRIGDQPQDRQRARPHHPRTLLATADEVIQ
jgi:acyl dehydratase